MTIYCKFVSWKSSLCRFVVERRGGMDTKMWKSKNVKIQKSWIGSTKWVAVPLSDLWMSLCWTVPLYERLALSFSIVFGSLPIYYCVVYHTLYFVSPWERPWRQSVFQTKTLVIARATCTCFLTRSKRNTGIDAYRMRLAACILGLTQWRHSRCRDETKYSNLDSALGQYCMSQFPSDSNN